MNTDHIIAFTLRAGAWSSLAVMLVALALWLAASPAAEGVARAGIVVLLATPVLRIVVACLAFFAEGDRRYGFISLAVLAIVLLASFFGLR